MKIVQLETFVVVAEELHFRRAAERLFMQPSSVSTQIAQLEAEYGTPLFIRNSRNVTLSPAGETLLAKARVTLASIADLEATARRLAEQDDVSLTVGLHDEGAAELNPIIVGGWRRRFPSGRLDMHEVRYDDMEQALATGDVDCLLASVVPGQFLDASITVVPLFTEGRVVVLPAGHPLASEPKIDVDTALSLRYLKIPLIDSPLGRFFLNHDDRDTSHDFETSATSLLTMLNHVALGDGVITVTHGVERFYARPDLAFVPAPGLEPCTICVVHATGDDRPPVLALIDSALDAVEHSIDLIPTAVPVLRTGT